MLSDNPWISLLGMVLSVIIITVLAYLFTRYVVGRKFSSGIGGQKTEQFRVLAQLAMGKEQRAAVIQAGSRYLLLGVTEQNISLLAELSEEDVASFISLQDTQLPGFKQSFAELLQRKSKGEDK